MKQLLKELIAVDSSTDNEAAIANYLALQMEARSIVYEQIGNSLIGKIAGTNSKKAFILNGHIDTVPVGDKNLWQTDPHILVVKAGKAYGLGVSDMKSGIVVILEILKHYSKHPPECDLWFMFAEGEEVNGAGTQKLLEYFKKHKQYYSETGGVILEPTDARAVGIGHKGNVFFEADAAGKAGHGSQQMKGGETALSKIAAFVNDLPLIQEKWNKEFEDPVLGSSTINATAISAPVTAPNVIPRTAKVRLDVRFNSVLAESLMPEIEKVCKEYNLTLSDAPIEFSPFGLCAQSSTLFAAFKQSLPELPLNVFPGAADQCFFTELGINMVIYGPGDPGQMHQSNESVRIGALTECKTKILKLLSAFSQM